ncbi:phosphoribosyltransferase family protein [Photobacterium sp. MCCC 1A19761]|uniref:phosphoribosyltransferase family protein n=1 Tax=Photobacterium sp. MCCC 1A19761 TaxID=3115000 RepID=UPI00307F42F8
MFVSHVLGQWMARTQRQCQLCQLPLDRNEPLWCEHCLARFPRLPYCRRCGATTPAPTSACGRCLSDPPPWQQCYRLGEYRFPLSQLIHQLKFGGKFWLAEPLGQQLASEITAPAPVLIPVPLHRHRRLHRSFNQSTLLAQAIARTLGSTCDSDALRRVRYTPPQHHLSRRERQQNLRQAFILKTRDLPDHVALVDDVITTGSTLTELTRLLLAQGCRQVDIYCLCYTPVHGRTSR